MFFWGGEEGCVQLGTRRGKSSYGSDSWGLLASTCLTLQYFSKCQGILSWEYLYLRLYRNSWWRSSLMQASEENSARHSHEDTLHCKAVLPWQSFSRKGPCAAMPGWESWLALGVQQRGRQHKRGWQEQPQTDNELAQEWGSSVGVLAVFPLAWHCSMWEWKVKLLAATEMESLKHHWCWALKEKCFLSH